MLTRRRVLALRGLVAATALKACEAESADPPSRVPPELVFDQGIGDLFTTRTAGGVLGDTIVGSMEFAVGRPDETPLVVILGHTGCGAVTASVDALQADPAQPSVPGEVLDIVNDVAFVVERRRRRKPVQLGEAADDVHLGTALEYPIDCVFNPERFLQLQRNFTAFDADGAGLTKRIAEPHQYFAVTKASDRPWPPRRATARLASSGTRRAPASR